MPSTSEYGVLRRIVPGVATSAAPWRLRPDDGLSRRVRVRPERVECETAGAVRRVAVDEYGGSVGIPTLEQDGPTRFGHGSPAADGGARG